MATSGCQISGTKLEYFAYRLWIRNYFAFSSATRYKYCAQYIYETYFREKLLVKSVFFQPDPVETFGFRLVYFPIKYLKLMTEMRKSTFVFFKAMYSSCLLNVSSAVSCKQFGYWKFLSQPKKALVESITIVDILRQSLYMPYRGIRLRHLQLHM